MRSAIEFINKLDSHNVHQSLICKLDNAHLFQSLNSPKDLNNSDFDKRCKEEMAKAHQIIIDNPRDDGKTWQKVIEEAENTAFFKGSIRFLFQDANAAIDWNNFDKKWESAQKYFDQNGVSEGYQKSAKLLRALLSRIDISEQWFGNHTKFWREMLLNKDYSNVIHELLMGTTDVKYECKDWIKDVHLLQELLSKQKDQWHIFKNWYGYSVLTRYSRREQNPRSPKDIVVLNEDRNNLLNNQKIVVSDDCKINNTNYLYGLGIQFTYNDNRFQWQIGNCVRMIDDTPECKPILRDSHQEDKKENWYSFYTNGVTDFSSFLEKLDCLIAQAEADKTKTPCYTICQNKL